MPSKLLSDMTPIWRHWKLKT